MKPQSSSDPEGLRRMAEARLKARGARPAAGAKDDPRRLQHELEVHQIELEMRNEELVAARADLEVELRHYTELYDFAPVGYFTLTIDGTIRRVNLSGTALVGVNRAPLMGRRFGLLVAEKDRPGFSNFLARVFAGTERQTCEVTLLQAGKKPVNALLEARRSGEEPECRVVVLDITDRKRAEDTQHESEARFRAVFEQAAVGVAQVGPDGRWLEVNGRLAAIVGYSREELLTKSFQDITHPEDLATDLGQVRQMLAGVIDHYALEKRYIRKDGSLVWINLTVSLVRDAAGAPLYFISIVEDIDARKRAEERLRASLHESADLKTALDEHAIVAITDPQDLITFVNDKFCAISKFSREELMGQNHRIINSGHHPTEFIRDLWTTIAHGKVWKGEIKNKAKDGSFYWVDTTVVPFLNEEGKPRQYVAISADITERKRAEVAFRESEELFAKAFRLSPDCVAIVRLADHTVIRANEAICRVWGRTPEEVIGQPTREYTAWPNEAERLAFMQTLADKGECLNYENTFRLTDGRLVDFNISSRMITYHQEACILSVMRDVTERKRIEEAVRQSEEFNRRIIESSSDCIKVLDLEGRLLSMSEGGQRLLEIQDLNRYLNSCWISFWQPGDQPRVRKAVEAARAGGMGRFQAFCLTEAGNPRWWDVIITPIRGASGQVEQLLSISRDISAQNQAEEKVRLLNVELEQRVIERTTQLAAANRELEAFSYSVSHDLRAPLRGMHGYVRMLQEDYGPRLDAEGNRLLGVVTSEALRMGRLIDDLLAFSRMGRVPVGRTRVDLAGLVRSVFEEATRSLPGAVPRLDLGPLPPAEGDPAMLRQVLANLLGNAVKFSRHQPAPVIEVGAAEGAAETTYHVKDNGVGFDEKYAHKLFGVFQRLHSEAEFEGTGVGLAIVQRVILRHGGKVWAEGKPGAGATFFFTLPIPKEPSP